MTKQKRIGVQFFDDAETHGLEPLMKTGLNDENARITLVHDLFLCNWP